MSDNPDVISLGEAIATVENIAAWLMRAQEGVALSWKSGDAEPVVFVPDARRAGFVLRCLMQTNGMA